jgi:tetratricopeptide (TPR) repeat protein
MFSWRCRRHSDENRDVNVKLPTLFREGAVFVIPKSMISLGVWGRALLAAIVLAWSSTAFAQADELQDVNQMLRNGQFDQALSRVNSFLASKPKDARGRFLKGLILAEQNKANDAIKIFSDLTVDYPELPGPYNNLAVLYAAQGQYDNARKSLEQAIRTHPSYATAHENLGDIYAKMASQAYDKALQLDRNNTTAQTKLNMIRDLFPADVRGVAAAKPPAAKPPVVAGAPVNDVARATTPPTTVSGAKPVPDAAPAKPVPPVAASGKRDSGEVVAAVNAWAAAWSANDVPGYLGAYAADFRPPGGASRAAWEAERKQRIAKPRRIQVTLSDTNVEMDDSGTRATVTFRQDYRSDALNSVNSKTLVMTRSGDKWLIQQERSGG